MHSVRLPRRSALCAAILTLVSVVSPGRLCAQVTGTVVGPGEAPLPGATVMLWTGSSEVARSVTDEGGRFRFDSTLAARATSVVARRIGFRPTSLSIGVQEGRAGSGAAHRDLRLALEQLPAPLPEVVVSAVRALCPRPEDPAARRLWERMRARYRRAPRDVGHAAAMTYARGEVAARDVGEVDESRLRPGSYGYSGQSRRAGFLALDSAYASRLSPTKPSQWVANPEYFHWWYPKLHWSLIEHFLEDSFGARHALSASTRAGGGWHVVFCGPAGSPARLEGTLEVAADTTLLAADWRFVTPPPEEDAGGTATFVPPDAAPAVLTPARSVYWRRLGGRRGRYYQEASVYRAWAYSVGDMWPDLPEPPADGVP